MSSFANRINEEIRRKRTPAVVGIDPSWLELPVEIQNSAIEEHGKTLKAVAEAYRSFGAGLIDAVADLTPAVKFQSAFFEAAGPHGLAVLDDLITKAKAAGLLVIYDGKRNDIGNTASAYASAFLGQPILGNERAFAADALTVNAYLGTEGLSPFVDACKQSGGGIFVLVRTSNPGAGALQDGLVNGVPVHEIVADWVRESAEAIRGNDKYSPVGAVVGATAPEQLVRLRELLPSSILLIPGYGAQGGRAKDCAPAFDSDGLGGIVNNSRGIIYAYKKSKLQWIDAARTALEAMIADLRSMS